MLPHACRVALILVGWSIMEPKPSRASQPYQTNIWTLWWARGGRCAPTSTVITPAYSHCHSEVFRSVRAWGERGVVDSKRKVCLLENRIWLVGWSSCTWPGNLSLAPSLKVFELTSQEECCSQSSHQEEWDSHLLSKDQFMVLSTRNSFFALSRSFKKLLDSRLQVGSYVQQWRKVLCVCSMQRLLLANFWQPLCHSAQCWDCCDSLCWTHSFSHLL